MRIEPGITLKAAEAVLGEQHSFQDRTGSETKVDDTVVHAECRWFGPKREVIVLIDSDRRVITCTSRYRVEDDESILDKILAILRDWFGP
jgi:hypothetical protein